MWLKHRLKRLKAKWRHLNRYFVTLSSANDIERQTDFKNHEHLVLILYGFGATRRSVSILETRLKNDDYGVLSFRLGGLMDLFNTAPIDRLAKEVLKKVERLQQKHQFKKLSIIGYSKGGLIGRYCLSHLNGEQYIHTLITLASPHRGNPWALLSSIFLVGLFSKGVRQMTPGSKFLRRLNASPLPENVYVSSISSAKDKSCPPSFCRLSNNHAHPRIINVTLPHLYHSDFIIKQSAYHVIRKHLEAGLDYARTCERCQ